MTNQGNNWFTHQPWPIYNEPQDKTDNLPAPGTHGLHLDQIERLSFIHRKPGTQMNHPLTWHIFCRVIDNYGDIGVCWRLARQLAQRYGYQVTLWVDQLDSFRQLCPGINPELSDQQQLGVRIRRWPEQFPDTPPGDVVIEAFGCELPVNYLTEMQACKPIWINLEYLSAEPWVSDYHLKNSPLHGLQKTFIFPGFGPQTGGLLRDDRLLDLTGRARTDQANEDLLHRLGLTSPPGTERLRISFFAYQNRALPALLTALAKHSGGCHLLVPIGQSLAALNNWLGESLTAGSSYRRDQLTLSAIPFTDLDTFDEILALADINFVRGEDSFVRAQVLGKPFIWQIYPQDEDAHLVKLEAFLKVYLADAHPVLASALRAAHLQWNHAATWDPDLWPSLLELLPRWREHAQRWQQTLWAQRDLTANIVHFCTNQL